MEMDLGDPTERCRTNVLTACLTPRSLRNHYSSAPSTALSDLQVYTNFMEASSRISLGGWLNLVA